MLFACRITVARIQTHTHNIQYLLIHNWLMTSNSVKCCTAKLNDKTSNDCITQHWRAFVQTFLPWKSNKYYIFWVFICSLRYPACNALLHVVICGSTKCFLNVSIKCETRILILSTGFACKNSLFLRNKIVISRIMWRVYLHINVLLQVLFGHKWPDHQIRRILNLYIPFCWNINKKQTDRPLKHNFMITSIINQQLHLHKFHIKTLKNN